MALPDPSETEAGAVATVADHAAHAMHEVREDGSFVAHLHRGDQKVTVLDFEYLESSPRRNRGAAVVHDTASFIDYVKRLESPTTTVWADQPHGTMTAILNDYMPYEQDEGLYGGWRDFTVRLDLQRDLEWQAWLRIDGQWLPQVDMAEFLEQHARTVTAPDAATMLEVATSMSATRTANFAQSVNLSTSDIQLSYAEETRGSTRTGRTEIPRELQLLLAPYVGSDPVEVRARFRYRITDQGRLSLGVVLIRPDLVERAAYADMLSEVQASIAAPVLSGLAPAPTGTAGRGGGS